MKKIVKPHKARKPSASTDVPSFARGKDRKGLIQRTAEYNAWRSTLPKNLQTETPDYDLYGAFKAGLQPEWNDEDKSYHLGSRDPKTGRILKKPGHPTFGQAIYNDMLLGYYPIYKDGEIYTENPFEYDNGKDKTWYDELNNSMLGAGIKFVDPTGISSYYDVYQSAQNMYNNPSWSNAGSLALETFGALPLIGKLGKALKIGKKIIKRGGEPELEKMGRWIIDQGYPRMIGITKDGADVQEYDKGKDSGIHIKKKNRGKFTAAAKRAGMGVQAYARKILSAPKGKYSPTLRRRAAFAKAASKFKH